MPPRKRSHRIWLELPASLMERVGRRADANEVNTSDLFYKWVTEAAQLAHRGYGHLLPERPPRARKGERGEISIARWKQGKDEYARCRSLIEAAGSSISTVLNEAGDRYDEAGGDIAAMDWPPQTDTPEAA
jgi:hypothetical protein